MSIVKIGDKVVDTEAMTVAGTMSIKAHKAGSELTLNVQHSYKDVPFHVILCKAEASDRITTQARLRKNLDNYTDGDEVLVDVATTRDRTRLSPEEVARRAVARLLGDPSIKLGDPRVKAVLEAAKGS